MRERIEICKCALLSGETSSALAHVETRFSSPAQLAFFRGPYRIPTFLQAEQVKGCQDCAVAKFPPHLHILRPAFPRRYSCLSSAALTEMGRFCRLNKDQGERMVQLTKYVNAQLSPVKLPPHFHLLRPAFPRRQSCLCSAALTEVQLICRPNK